MIKVFSLLSRRADVSVAFFHEHWSTVHADHARKITSIARYVQAHRIGNLPGLPVAICEGIAEVWFEDLATAATMRQDPNYTEHAALDEPNFMDVARFARVVTEQRVLRAGPPIERDDAGAKALVLLKRDPALSPDEFASRLADVGLDGLIGSSSRVTLAIALPLNYADGADATFDAVAEFWFADAPTATAAWGDGERVLGALSEITDLPTSAGMLVEELRVIWPEPAPV